MIQEIYSSVLKMAAFDTLPGFGGITFTISKDDSSIFWENKQYDKERAMLFQEFEPQGNSLYTNKLCGISFSVQFYHAKP